jgi:hypothetical protein
MLRDAFGQPLNDCTECRHAIVAPAVKGSMVMSVMCKHPSAIKANAGNLWSARIARDCVCRGEHFSRVKA